MRSICGTSPCPMLLLIRARSIARGRGFRRYLLIETSVRGIAVAGGCIVVELPIRRHRWFRPLGYKSPMFLLRSRRARRQRDPA